MNLFRRAGELAQSLKELVTGSVGTVAEEFSPDSREPVLEPEEPEEAVHDLRDETSERVIV